MTEGPGKNKPRRPGRGSRGRPGKRRGGLRLKRLGPGRLRAGPSPLRARDGARLRGRDRALARGGRRGGARRTAVRAAGVRRQPLGPRRAGADRTRGVQRPVPGAGPFRLCVRAGPACAAARISRAGCRAQRLANRPFYDAIDGLAQCYEALGKPDEAAGLRDAGAPALGRGPAGRPGAAGRRGDGPAKQCVVGPGRFRL